MTLHIKIHHFVKKGGWLTSSLSKNMKNFYDMFEWDPNVFEDTIFSNLCKISFPKPIHQIIFFCVDCTWSTILVMKVVIVTWFKIWLTGMSKNRAFPLALQPISFTKNKNLNKYVLLSTWVSSSDILTSIRLTYWIQSCLFKSVWILQHNCAPYQQIIDGLWSKVPSKGESTYIL